MIYLFDYFDTIVHRTCYPEATKKIWASRLKDLFHIEKDVYSIRSQVEAQLCKENAIQTGDLEFSADTCYERLYDILKIDSVTKSGFVYACLDLEINVECSVQELDKNTIALLQRYSEEGHKCYVVSDFYLSREAFMKMINFHNIQNLIKDIFVSSDYGLTKRSGKLYKCVLDNLKVSPSQCSMYGDNPHSDYQVPIELGISANLKNNSEVEAFYLTKKLEEKRQNIRDELTELLYKDHDKGGVFPEFVFDLFYFSKYVADYATQNQIKDIFFLAREGQFLKTTFDYYLSLNLPCSEIRSHYVLVSRRSTFLPSLTTLENENFDTIFKQYSQLSPIDFFKNLGLEKHIDQFKAIFPAVDFSKKIYSFKDSEFLDSLVRNEQFKQIYERERERARNAINSYLHQFISEDSHKVLLVDVGWKGTIQDNLERIKERSAIDPIFNNSIEYYGLYMGLVAGGGMNNKMGVLFDYRDKKAPAFAVFDENKSLFESILAADHGSAVGYIMKSDGHSTVLLDSLKEQEIYIDKIRPLLTTYFKLFQRLTNWYTTKAVGYDSLYSIMVELHKRMVFYPTDHEIKWYKSLFHEENFGVFDDSHYSFAREESLLKRFINGLSIIKNKKLPFFVPWPFIYIKECCGQPFIWLYRVIKIKGIK